MPPLLLDALRALVRAGDGERVGWKIAGGIRAVEDLLGPGGVTVGHLTSATLLPDGGTFDAVGVRVLRVEAELALEVGPDLALGGLGVALEIVDLGATDAPLAEVVADNLLHRAFALGPTVACGAALGKASIQAGGRRLTAPVGVDAEQVIATVAGQLSQIGEQLWPGDRILSGSLAQIPARPGDIAVAEIEGLGRLELAIG